MQTRLTCLLLTLVACAGNEDNGGLDTDASGAPDADTDTDTDDTDTLPDPQATLVAGGAVSCAETTRTTTSWFVKRSVESAPDTDEMFPAEPWVWGSGLVVADFDDDGLTDIFAANEAQPAFFRNNGVGLDDVAPAVFLGTDVTYSSGGSAADYDGDGDLDLLITRYMHPNVLMQNLGAGQFQDVTAAVGLPTEGRRSMSSAWGDYDRDGDLDLYIGNYGFVDESIPSEYFLPAEADWFLRNDAGVFTDLSATIPVEVHDGYSYAVAWIDLDDNGFPDLYTVNDFGTAYPNKLLWNEGGVLTLDGNASGLDGPWTGMGLDFADINGDGVADLYQPVWNNHVLLESLSTPDGPLWLESSGSRLLDNDLTRDQKVAWGGDFGDLDNDGDEDLLVQFGWVEVGTGENWGNALRQPDAVYLMDATGKYTDSAPALGMDDMGIGRGGVLADFNNDGFLDVVKRDVSGSSIAYLSMCDTNAWTRIRLHGVAPNTFAIGAKVRVTAGGKVQTNWVRAGGLSLGSSGPPEAHFGLGLADTIDRIEIVWPDGRVSLFADVASRQILDVTQLPPTL
ncbi:MAG: CRTAC1 family protein [Deltaproteobacteria bacterium]|nr:CRTAC1 family protein [Deltaproteobacteria bacterium]